MSEAQDKEKRAAELEAAWCAGFRFARMRILRMLEGPPQLGAIRAAIAELEPPTDNASLRHGEEKT